MVRRQNRKNLTKNQRKLRRLAKILEDLDLNSVENIENSVSDQEILMILNEKIHVPMLISPIVTPVQMLKEEASN